MKIRNTIIASLLLLFMCSFDVSAQKKDWGVGVRLGDPTGFSLKKYMANDRALELIAGRSSYWTGYDYDYHYKHNNKYRNTPGYNYGGVDRSPFPFSLQLRYLLHYDIKPVDGLQWYFGFGGQFRFQRYEYYYYDNIGRLHREGVSDIGLGLDGIGGAEYSFKNVPFSVAAEINFYVEAVDRPFLFLLQGGIVGRYNF